MNGKPKQTNSNATNLTLAGLPSANPAIQALIAQCGDCVDFDMCDFANFAIFLSGSKALGAGCTEELKKEAMLAWSLGLALIFEIENANNGNATLGDAGICAIVQKIGSLITKCCSLPELHLPSKSDKSPIRNYPLTAYPGSKVLDSHPSQRGAVSGPETNESIVNERLGLTPGSNKVKQENIKLDPAYKANCSNIKEMLPGAGIIGVRVIGMAHNGKNITVDRDTCLKAGKTWNTLNNTCYCLNERDTPTMVVRDRKVDKKYFHLAPPTSWAKVAKIEELNLDEEGVERFNDIISAKEKIDLSKLRYNKCALDRPCKWYSCLIDGIPNYFLGCGAESRTGRIAACYYDYKLKKSNLDDNTKSSILAVADNSNRHCCDKCHQVGCGCRKVGDDCDCTGVDNRGIPCSQITSKTISGSVITDASPVLRTNDFESDAYAISHNSRLVSCCNTTSTCPGGMTDAQCCETMCRDDFLEKVLANVPASRVKRVRNAPFTGGTGQAREGWKCTDHDDCNWGCCHKGQCGGQKPCDDERTPI